jgi:hypothetical protein
VSRPTYALVDEEKGIWRPFVRVTASPDGRPLSDSGKVWGPREASTGHPSELIPCPACGKLFVKGDYTMLVALGPGDSAEDREKARDGRYYSAVATECHEACVTGEETE